MHTLEQEFSEVGDELKHLVVEKEQEVSVLLAEVN